LVQELSLDGKQNAISQGRLFVDAEAWLGGVGSIADDAELKCWFEGAAPAPLGSPETLGPVTFAERNSVRELQARNAARADGIRVSVRDMGPFAENDCASNTNSTAAPALV